MKNRTFLYGVGTAALAGALAASPAHASNGNDFGWQFDLAELFNQQNDDAASEEPAEEDAPAIEIPTAPEPELVTPTAPPSVPPGDVVTVDTFAGVQDGDFNGSPAGAMTLALPRFGDNLVTTINNPDAELIVRDDVGVDFGDPDNTQPSVVHLFQLVNATGGIFFNCTGTVINPRTILTAAHCVNDSATRSSEAYGLPGSGAERTVLISSGQDSFDRLINFAVAGASYSQGGSAQSTDVIIHPSSNPGDGGLPFPWADVALIAVDEPITDVPSAPILLTPITELTHVVQVGYGTNGTGLTGGTNAGSSFLRRVGENMLGLVGSTADYIDGVFPAFAPSSQVLGLESQVYYWTDFDNPDRTPEEEAGCDFTGTNISCNSLEAVFAIDYFDDDALPLESGTAPGDSGSPLIVDELYAFPVVTAVLSGGFDFFGLGSAYSDVSFYNPLYPFFEFITENTPYKYVSAAEGDGVWSDPTRWTQDLDPGFFIDDGTGTLVNGIPEGNEPGILESGPKLGTVLGTDISDFPTDPTPGFEDFPTALPESSVLLGPGSTGFVPNNTDGTPGESFANPAQYFEVHLNRAGTTTVDMDVEIDKLVLANLDAGLVIPEAWDFTSLIDVEQLEGRVEIDGTLNTPIYTLGVGELAGDGGEINTLALFNVAGLVSAAGDGEVGQLTINGDYVQTSGGALWADFTLSSRRRGVADFYDISGLAVLDGALIVATEGRRVRFGQQFTILSAGAIDGDFSSLTFVSPSPILTAEHRIEGGDVIITLGARSIGDLVGRGSGLNSLGEALDAMRVTSFTQFSELFTIVDNATINTLGATLTSLTPVNAFSQTFTANSFSQRFTGQIAQRSLSLRGGSRAASAFTAAGNGSYAIAGTAPTEANRIGVFGSASGIYLNGGQNSGILGNGVFGSNGVSGGTFGANAFEQASFQQAGELTIGADVRVTEKFSFGVAVSNIRNSQLSSDAFQAAEDTSRSVAIFATYSDGGLFADGYAGTSEQEFGVERGSQGEFVNRYYKAVGQSDGQQMFGGMRLGYAFDLAKGLEVGPVASLDYVRTELDGYDEFGAGPFGLSVADRSFTSLGAKMGAMASVDIRTGETSAIRAFGSVAYARELADTQDVVTAHFFGAADTPFTIANQLDPEWVSVNAGAEMVVGTNLTASVSVTSDMGRGLLSNDQGQVSLNWRF